MLASDSSSGKRLTRLITGTLQLPDEFSIQPRIYVLGQAGWPGAGTAPWP